MALASREQTHAWELRTAWALGREVALVLDPDHCTPERVRGLVVRVAPSGTAAWLDDGGAEPLHIPCEAVLAIRAPHFHEDGDRARRHGKRYAPPPGQLAMFGGDSYGPEA